MHRRSLGIFSLISLLILSLSGCSTLDSMQVKLGIKPSAAELVRKGCYLYRKIGPDTSSQELTYFRRAVNQEEKYRRLLQVVRSLPKKRVIFMQATDNELRRKFGLDYLEATYIIDGYCK